MHTDQSLLSVLTREGVLINVSVRFFRGCKKLKPEDIGLDPGDVSDRLTGWKGARNRFSGVCATEGPTNDDFVSFSDEVFHRDQEVRSSGEHHGQHFSCALKATRPVGMVGIV